MKPHHYVIATIGYVLMLPFVLYWVIRAWLAGGTDD